MPFIKNVGQTVYRGADGENILEVPAGTIVEVGEEKAKQLKTDFPKNWADSSKEDFEKTHSEIKSAYNKNIEDQAKEAEQKKVEETKVKEEKAKEIEKNRKEHRDRINKDARS